MDLYNIFDVCAKSESKIKEIAISHCCLEKFPDNIDLLENVDFIRLSWNRLKNKGKDKMKIELFKTKQSLIILMAILLFILMSINEMNSQNKFFEPNSGFVPNKETAELVAEAILVQIYKRENIEKQKPFKTFLNVNDVWVIKGSTPNLNKNEIYIGGTFYIEIQKKDCKILKVTHGK